MSIEMKKEKNLVQIFSNDMNYIYDINTGELKNIKTQRIIKQPKLLRSDIENMKVSISTLFNKFCLDTFYKKDIIIVNNRTTLIKNFDKYFNLLKSLELENFETNMSQAIRIYFYAPDRNFEPDLIKSFTNENLNIISKKTKDLKAILEIYNVDNMYSFFNLNHIVRDINIKNSDFYNKAINFGLSPREAFNLSNQLIHPIYKQMELTETELDIMEYYLFNQKFYASKPFLDIKGQDIIYFIGKYFSACKELNKQPIKATNGFREMMETFQTYSRYKETLDKEKWQAIYNLVADKLSFSYGNYEVVPPQEPQDLVIEGDKMHHCVGSYVNKVLNGDCYIVFIRNKNNLTKPYITAQVYPDGDLGQYYLAYDRKIETKEDIDFQTAYQAHLKQVWEE